MFLNNQKIKSKQNIDSPLLWEVLGLDSQFTTQGADKAYAGIINSRQVPSRARLAWKVLRDANFRAAYQTLKSSQKIIEAGFFEDEASLDYDNTKREKPDWLTTPVFKITDFLSKQKDVSIKKSGPYVVLLATGSFSPFHEGHLSMMEEARREMVSHGYEVIGGYISPSHDGYVSIKDSGAAAKHATERLELCRAAARSSDWLMVDPWEALHCDFAINYTDVILRLESYLNAQFRVKRKIEVVYVFGSDNALFARAFIGQGKCVCVKRKGSDSKLSELRRESWLAGNKRIYISRNYSGKTNIASSLIRNTKGYQADDFDGNSHPLGGKKIREKQLYVIRDDSAWSTDFWQNHKNVNKIKNSSRKVVQALAELIHSSYRQNQHYDLLPCYLDNIQLEQIAKKLNELNNTISLDAFFKGTYDLAISRIFAISDEQFKPVAIGPRPGSADIKTQTNLIAPGDYVLIEDDIATGATLNFAVNHLNPGVNITSVKTLLNEGEKKNFHGLNGQLNLPVFDILDARDFIAGSRLGGLVVLLPNGKLARAPYAQPYVSLVTRAKLPVRDEISISKKIWAMNEKFFQSITPAIRLKQTDKFFQVLMDYIGFDGDTEMEAICRWHKERL